MNMKSVSPEILSPNTGNGGMTVLEDPVNSYFAGVDDQLMNGGFLFGNGDLGLGELLLNRPMKPDPGIENGWTDRFLGKLPGFGNGSEFEMRSYPIPRTISCPPEMAAESSKGKEAVFSSAAGIKDSGRKRKVDKAPNLKVVVEEKSPEKKMKGCLEEQIKENKNGTSNDNSKENPKSSEVPKPDYIHVRARRGQATDSHSLAERVRREKISERMKYLQDLVPGCHKITGKAGMLDEIINYVQSLQKQVEFLSMKIAAINPTLNFDTIKELQFPSCTSNVPCAIGMSLSNTINNPIHNPFNALTQSGLNIANHPDVTLRRTISAPVSIPDTFLDASCLNVQQIQSMPWDAGLQNLSCMEYQSTPFISSQSFTGFSELSQVKLEM